MKYCLAHPIPHTVLFYTESQNISVSENTMVGSEVTRLVATDADQDTISFSIISGDPVNSQAKVSF